MTITPGDRVAVTGAGGFIGSAITRRLLEHGAWVVAVTEPAREHRNLRGLDVEVQPADVRDPGSVRRALLGSRFVFHTAALYGFWAKDPSVFYRVNVEGTRNVLGAASAEGVERIVYTSTSLAGAQAAVRAGLGITVLPRAMVPGGLVTLGTDSGLPQLDDTEIALLQDPGTLAKPTRRLAEHIIAALEAQSAYL